MSWKVEVEVLGEKGSWHSNPLRFGSQEEAARYGSVLALRWLSVACVRECWTNDPVNARVDEHGISRAIPPG